MKDTITHTYTYSWYEPLYKTKAEVRADIKSNAPREIQNPGKIFIIGKYIFLNEISRGIHVLDNSNPSSPQNIAFINIPGNVDIAVKGNTLYADLYSDLVTLDISNPLLVINTKIVENVFPDNSYSYFYGFSADSSKVVYDWKRHDTTIVGNYQPSQPWRGGVFDFLGNASSQNSNNSQAPSGIAGSMARFALVNNYLYTVGNSDLNIFNISTPNSPAFTDKVNIGSWNIETIFPFKNNLFIGSTTGMFIYDITGSPSNPVKVGEFTHVRSCDPVVADDNFAYVTLHNGTVCGASNNELNIVRLNNLSNSELVKTFSLMSPHGLSKDGNLLFICDGTDGLKVFDASDFEQATNNSMNLKLIKHFSGLETFDVIANKNIALVVATDGLYQYDYSNVNNIHLLSKINIAK